MYLPVEPEAEEASRKAAEKTPTSSESPPKKPKHALKPARWIKKKRSAKS